MWDKTGDTGAALVAVLAALRFGWLRGHAVGYARGRRDPIIPCANCRRDIERVPGGGFIHLDRMVDLDCEATPVAAMPAPFRKLRLIEHRATWERSVVVGGITPPGSRPPLVEIDDVPVRNVTISRHVGLEHAITIVTVGRRR